MNRVEIELRPHVGKNYNKKLGTIVDIEHDQFIVMASVNGSPMIQVGYVGKSDGAPLNGIDTLRALPVSVQQQIKEAVEEKKGPVEMFVPADPSPVLLDGVDTDLE